MSEELTAPDARRPPDRPDETPDIPRRSTTRSPGRSEKGWKGATYYGRSQLKEAPFNNWAVGGYIFLAAVSGSSATVSGLARVAVGEQADGMLRRARYLGLLAPTIGSALLVWDLHTPQRAMNMMRIAKRTSPMSIGTWLLTAFTLGAMPAFGCQLAEDVLGERAWLPRRLLRALGGIASVPASVFGVGISTYTASLLASTSVPLWAAAPRGLAVRFAASSIAAGAASLSLGERDPTLRRKLDLLAAGALATEFVASVVSHRRYVKTGVAPALDGPWGQVEKWGVNGGGVLLPIALSLAAVARVPGCGRATSMAASVMTLAGSGMLRIAMMSAGDVSARTPEISFRFAQPDNLPRPGPVARWLARRRAA